MEGKKDDLMGRAKEAAGDLTDDDDLKREGKVDRATGKVKEKAGEAADKAREKVKDACWRVYEMPCGHDAMVDMPERLTEILLEVA